METTRGPRQLPTYFKKIGIAITALAVAPVVYVIAASVEIAKPTRGLFFLLSEDALILGMLFIALAKDKVEDEMIKDVRLKSMARAFVAAVGFVLLQPLYALVFSHPIAELKGRARHVHVIHVFSHIHESEGENVMKNTLKVERAKRDLTQQDLADKTGVSRQTINSIKAGRVCSALDRACHQNIQNLQDDGQ